MRQVRRRFVAAAERILQSEVFTVLNVQSKGQRNAWRMLLAWGV
jgi:hypothetical protein